MGTVLFGTVLQNHKKEQRLTFKPLFLIEQNGAKKNRPQWHRLVVN